MRARVSLVIAYALVACGGAFESSSATDAGDVDGVSVHDAGDVVDVGRAEGGELRDVVDRDVAQLDAGSDARDAQLVDVVDAGVLVERCDESGGRQPWVDKHSRYGDAFGRCSAPDAATSKSCEAGLCCFDGWSVGFVCLPK